MVWTVTAAEKTPVDRLGIQNVSLLLHGNGANGSTTIADSSPTPKTVTAFGNAQISTAQSKFGGSSIAFDGNGDWALAGNNSGYVFGANDFTVEAFIRISAFNNFNTIVATRKGAINSTTGWSLGYTGTPGGGFNSRTVVFYTDNRVQGSLNLLLQDTWYHVAAAREGTTLRLFLDGIVVATAVNAQVFTDDRLFAGATVSDNNAAGEFLNGYIDELRITKGIARYTSNFIPPTAPFPDI